MEDNYTKEEVIASLKSLSTNLRTRSIVDQRSYLIALLSYRFGMIENDIAKVVGCKRTRINYNKRIAIQFQKDKLYQQNVYVYAQMYPFDFSVIEIFKPTYRAKRVEIDMSNSMYNKLKIIGSMKGIDDIRLTVKYILDKSVKIWEE